MRPPCGLRWLGRTCFQTRLTPSTTQRFLAVRMRSTLPVLPLSRPAITTTLSPLRICRAMISSVNSNHFTCQRNDLHEILVAQLAGDSAEDARAARVVVLVDHHGRVLVKAHIAAIDSADHLLGAHNHAADDLAFFHITGGNGLLHCADDDVADVGDTALESAAAAAAAKHLDAHRLLGAGVIGDVDISLLLNHESL